MEKMISPLRTKDEAAAAGTTAMRLPGERTMVSAETGEPVALRRIPMSASPEAFGGERRPDVYVVDRTGPYGLAAAEGLEPYFVIDMPPLFGVMSALILSFVLGLALASVKGNAFRTVLKCGARPRAGASR